MACSHECACHCLRVPLVRFGRWLYCASLPAAKETDLDDLALQADEQAKAALPSYQEALLQAVDKDEELTAAFAEMRFAPFPLGLAAVTPCTYAFNSISLSAIHNRYLIDTSVSDNQPAHNATHRGIRPEWPHLLQNCEPNRQPTNLVVRGTLFGLRGYGRPSLHLWVVVVGFYQSKGQPNDYLQCHNPPPGCVLVGLVQVSFWSENVGLVP